MGFGMQTDKSLCCKLQLTKWLTIWATSGHRSFLFLVEDAERLGYDHVELGKI